MPRRLASIDVRRTYRKPQALARLLAIRQALDIIVRVIVASPRREFTGREIARLITASPR